MDELLLVSTDSRRGTRAPRRRGTMDREDGARGWEDPGGGDGGCRAEEELLSCWLERGKEEDLVVVGWLDWMEQEMDGSVVAGFGSGKIPRKEEPCPSALVGPVERSSRGRWVAAVKRIWMDWTG